MDGDYQELIDLTVSVAQEGKLGDSIRSALEQYKKLGGVSVFLKCAIDAFAAESGQPPEIAAIKRDFSRAIVHSHRTASAQCPEVAGSLVCSNLRDFPGIPGTCLLPRFNSLAMAALGSRSVAHSDDQPAIWNQVSRLFLAYNEFLNALLGFVILCVVEQNPGCARRVFSSSYANRIQEIRNVSGVHRELSVMLRLARPRIRNALAHGTAWLNPVKARVDYQDLRGKKDSIKLTDFMALVMIGSHLAEAYLAGIGLIVIGEHGSAAVKDLLPEEVRLFMAWNH